MARIRLLLALLLLLTAAACRKAEAPRTGTAPAKESVARKQLLEIHVDLTVNVASGDDAARLARQVTDRVVAAGGFAESASITSDGARVVLRVPPSEIDSVRAILAAEGPLARETRSSRDVTDAVIDLDARVKAAKIEETRLLELLQNKTGNLADVLAVEKALAEVRERVERLEAEQRAAHARVDLATLTVDLDVRGAFDGAPLGQQLVLAAREGVSAARTALVIAATTALRAGPTLLIVAGLAWSVLRIVRRVRQA